jgi:predicted TIM-barrel fold metal-dependent hydrolase
MDKFGIEQTWLLNWECPARESLPSYNAVTPGPLLGEEGPVPFSRCLSYMERAPGRFVLGYAPDPRLPDACERLRAAHDIYGAKICGELKVRMMYDDPDALLLFRAAGELKMPVVFHLQYCFRGTHRDPWGEWYGGTIDAVERALAACPDTVFLGHAPGFWIHISNDELYKTVHYPPENSPVVSGGRLTELLLKYPNLHCDMSAGSGCYALRRDPGFAKTFLTEFQDRVLYARDYFDNQHQEFINSLGLPEPALEKIYRLNAEKLLA